MVRKKISKLPIVHPIVNKYIRKTPLQALRSVVSKDGMGVYASSDTLFRGAVFGRDSLEVAEDLILLRPRLVKTILITMASLQGEEFREDNEEEPGKILHEYRRAVVDRRRLKDTSKHIFDTLSELWGGDEKSVVYYGSLDATPLFIRVLCRYCDYYGPEILKRRIVLRSGHQVSMGIVLENALSFLLGELKRSKSGLLEYRRLGPHGLLIQAWKDSKEFYVHNNGELANHNQPISSIEVQAIGYDALKLASKYIPSKHNICVSEATKLRDKTIELLWLPKASFFALGTDFDSQNRLRIIDIETANPAGLLDSMFFDDLPPEDRQKYISGIARNIMGTHFLTDAGIRSKGLSEASLIPFWDYHGSFTTWPKETYDIAKGLRRQGFPKLATELENRLLNAINAIRNYSEFVYVDFRGRVLGAASAAHHHAELVLVNSVDRPEKIQAWTVSAVVAILANRKYKKLVPRIKKRNDASPGWQDEIEREVLVHIPVMPWLRSKRTLSARYPSYPYEVKGKKDKIIN
ncbi:hypothetical protein KW801_00110 [Candidatus Saccharibacteria bacterium]|nr:hypothetical protein [Candidatus Saccharibacteria bacterium]